MKLKAFLFAMVLGVLTVGQASAQKFDIGVEAGANFANMLGSATDLSQIGDPNTYKLGFMGGGFLSLNFGNSFAIRPEILYEQKGAAFSGSTTTIESDYIEVPVLLKLGLGTPVINPSILLGPTFSWNILSKDISGGSLSNVNTSDIGVVGGVEIDIDKFLISARYELGLENVQNNVNYQNGVITLLAGYSFL